ncbi:MAG: acyl-CoA dehydrogenase family protein, partial [Ilumatobacteraceae bacterium]
LVGDVPVQAALLKEHCRGKRNFTARARSLHRAMQVHGGIGYSRHKPFEHIYRHHRRYRITEGAEEIQMRRVAGYMFGYMNQQAPKGVASVKG